MKKISWKKEYLYYIAMFILLTITHFSLFTKNILTADVLLNNSFYNGYSWEISLGRFGLFVVGLLKSYLSVPIIDTVISFLLLIAITYFLIKLFEIDDKIQKTFIVLLMVISPIVSATLLFHYCSIAYFIAFLAGVLSVYIYYRFDKKPWKYILPVCLIVLSLSMYQAYLSLIVTTFMLYQIKKIMDQKMNYKESGIYLLLLIGGVVLYFIGMKLSLVIFHIDMASYSNANSIGLSTILHFPQKFIDSYRLFFEMFFTDKLMKNIYMKNIYFYIGIGILWILTFGLQIKNKKNSFKEKILILVLILLIPVFLNSVIFVISDTKLQLLMSASYLILPIFFISFLKKDKLSILTFILLGLLLRNYYIQDQATYLTLEETYHKYDVIFQSVIQSHINHLDKKFIVVGNTTCSNQNLKNMNYGYISDEGLFWDEYNLRKLGFERFVLETYGLPLKFGEEETYEKALKQQNFSVLYELDDTFVIDLNYVISK